METTPKIKQLRGSMLVFVILFFVLVILVMWYILSFTLLQHNSCVNRINNEQLLKDSNSSQSSDEVEFVEQKCSHTLPLLISSIPRIRGRVEKKGMLPLDKWLTTSNNVHLNKLFQYIDTKEIEYNNDSLVQKGEIVDGSLRVPMSGPCAVFVNHKYKFIFIKNPKVAGTSIWGYFGWICKDDMAPEKVGNCFEKADLEHMPFEEVEKLWSEYTVFATSRNPFARGASAYKYLLGRRKSNKTECSNPSFELFSQFPFVIGLQTRQFDCIENHQHDFFHVENQAQCLMTANGESAVDFIVSMENLGEDFQQLLQVLVQRNKAEDRNTTFIRNKEKQLKQLQVGPEKEAYTLKILKECGFPCLYYLLDYYQDDFRFFQYPTCVEDI
eukprot:TRINITY_DN7440_c0_g1_i6.p1 TRINITY_DN7440_c0_g1~~TRINITY_DN7440_c0_g1_i6.p1  ORF type:complete len:428 (+),score=16.72 TRINITY_DN7440_c0_g1_i6:133-1284(+)